MTTNPDKKAKVQKSSGANRFSDEHGPMKKVVCVIVPIECYNSV